ncbi:MAG: hypothetical protein M1830_000689 [Pleopsidium flavum]|nr:MAG: hypothetical protein M1830_000689 [Pleopsidium flavum]
MAEFHPIMWVYQLIQWILDSLLSPSPPRPNATLSRPRIAIIGAGLTGVSAAAHCVGHGFDVTIFEAGGPENLGGIWSRVNNTSGLQIHSIMYRFHPSVHWTRGYPDRKQIVSQITQLWKRYALDERTKFKTRVTSVVQDKQGRWIINDPSNGRFDGVMAAVGTCGEPKMPHIPGQEKFKGDIIHSSRLDGKSSKGKKVLVIGGGASAVEALEFVVHTDAAETNVLARSDKWIIPRNPLVDIVLALNIFGEETIFSWIPESLLRLFFYRDLKDLAPTKKGIFTDTPMVSCPTQIDQRHKVTDMMEVNSDIFQMIRSGKAKWLRGDIISFTETGIKYNHRATGVPKNGPGHEIVVEGDMVIMATGYQRPSLSFLPDDVFQDPYQPPNWYLQTFPPEHMSICANNCTYLNAIGTVGNYHIGIYTRLLLMFLVDPLTRPQEYWMKRWIDMTRLLKSKAPGGAFDFFTYAELIYWFVFCVAINPFRWKWAVFVFFGIGTTMPLKVVQKEDRIRNGLGMRQSFA